MMQRLQLIVLQGKTRTYKFNKDRIVIGSLISADLKLKGEGISPIHAVLEKGVIFDLASDTGVFVNGKKLPTHSLKDGDVISIGKNEWTYYLMETTKEIFKSSPDKFHEVEGRLLFLDEAEDLRPLNLENEREVIEIFDYRRTTQKALEAVMSWHGTILSIKHFIKEKFVHVGPKKKNDFGTPPLLSNDFFPIAIQNQKEFFLNLDTQMRGVIQKGGQLKTIEDLRKSLPRGAYGYELSIGKNDYAKISVGEIDFYFSHTFAPPRLKRRRFFERDSFFLKVFFSSMGFSAMILYGLFQLRIDRVIDTDQVPERIATILYQPEKFIKKVAPLEKKPPDVEKKSFHTTEIGALKKKDSLQKKGTSSFHPKKINPISFKAKKAAFSKVKQGQGALAKGLEGAPKTIHAAMKKVQTNFQNDESGSLDLLKSTGGKMASFLGGSTSQFGKNKDKVDSIGNFNAHGNGGLALAGKSRGGGGTAQDILGRLGTKGAAAGRIGTGAAAVGLKRGALAGQDQITIRSQGPEDSVVVGSIDRDAVADAILAHKDEFRLCYEKEINAESPGLAGEIETSFLIGASGRVTKAAIESSSLHHSNTERCVLVVLKRIQFPIPKGSGIVEVRFPFKFNPVGGSR